MPTSTPQEIIQIYCPSSPPDPRTDDLIELSTAYIAESTFGDKFFQAQALWVCHFFMLEKQGGGDSTSGGSGVVGGIKSVKEGDLQKTFGGPSSSVRDNRVFLSQTSTGQQLLSLWDACILMPRNRMV